MAERAKGTYSRRRVDNNQADIVAALRAVGASVQILSGVGHGCPDLLVGYKGVNYLMECKSDPHQGKNALTEDERKFFDNWQGQAFIVFTPEGAVTMLQDR